MWRSIMTRRMIVWVICAVIFAGLCATALIGARVGQSATPEIVKGGTVTYALPPNTSPNYIFPLYPVSHGANINFAFFQPLLFRPLYSFGIGTTPSIDYEHSIGKPPTWSNGGKSVTITLNEYRWSNGEPVSAQDVQFWQSMVTANKANWVGYVPGEYPDNVAGTKVLGPRTIRFDFKRQYSQPWIELNELSQITPMPEAWNITSMGAAPGSGGCTPAALAKCVDVYTFLAAQASTSPTTYATNPLWGIVDGPWKLSSLDSSGQATFVPNAKYSGPDKPHIDRLIAVPFTSGAAEYAALRAGQLTFGYVPPEDTPQNATVQRMGYALKRWIRYGFSDFAVNLNNPTAAGATFRQVYFRQVLEELVNQKSNIKNFYHGYATEVCGPVPSLATSQFGELQSPYEKSCPFAYNPAKAASTLKAHGWTVVPGGVDTCANPGTGPHQCGAGIPQGTKLQFNYVYATGNQAAENSIDAYVSDAAKVGIQFSLRGTTVAGIFSTLVKCKPSQPSCNWEVANLAGSFGFFPNFYPVSAAVFGTNGGQNSSNYSSLKMDKLLEATRLRSKNPLAALYRYENYATSQLPLIWQQKADFELAAIKSNLHGFRANLVLFPEPSLWYFTK